MIKKILRGRNIQDEIYIDVFVVQLLGLPRRHTMTAYPESFAWRVSLRASRLAAWSQLRSVTAGGTVWTAPMKNAVVGVNRRT